jgi:hypothetical protein
MSATTLSLYETADWGARIAGVARVHHDARGTLFVEGVRVEGIQTKGHFSVLSCADGSTSVVLTSFLRLVQAPDRNNERDDTELAPES